MIFFMKRKVLLLNIADSNESSVHSIYNTFKNLSLVINLKLLKSTKFVKKMSHFHNF
jgi:hypothetical protein